MLYEKVRGCHTAGVPGDSNVVCFRVAVNMGFLARNSDIPAKNLIGVRGPKTLQGRDL